MWPLLMMLWTSSYRDPPLDMTLLYRVPLSQPLPLLDIEPHCTEVSPSPISDILWPRLETCSNLVTWRPHSTGTDICWWRPVQTCSPEGPQQYWHIMVNTLDLFKHVYLGTYSSEQHQVMATDTEAYTVSKQVVCTLLEWGLVIPITSCVLLSIW